MQQPAADGAPRDEARANTYVDQWFLGCVREESFEPSIDETDASWVAGLPDSRHSSELEDVLSPLSVRGNGDGDGDGIYDEMDITDRRQRTGKIAQSVPASVPRLSLNDFGSYLSKLPEVRAVDDEETYEIEEGSDGLHSRDDSVTECDSRPITARSRCSSQGDSTVSREGSRDSRRTHAEDSQSDSQPLSARSFDLRALSARGPGVGGGSDTGGNDVSDSMPMGARTASGDLCPRGLPPFSPRFLSPRVGPIGPQVGLGGGGGGFGSARPSPRIHGVTSAGPRSILSQADMAQGAGPWGIVSGIVGDSPRQRQSEAMVATLSLSQHKDLDNAARRVAQLEELLQKAQEENSQLQSQLQAHLASAAGLGEGSDGTSVSESGVRGIGELGDREGEDREGGGDGVEGKETQDSEVEAAEILAVNGEVSTEAHRAQPDAEHGSEAPRVAAAGVKGFRGTLEEGQEFARKWEIASEEVCRIRCIGRGAAGAVYEGRWRGGEVAIKELELDAMRDSDDPIQNEMLLSFRHEVSRMAFLRHPNVVSFYGIVWRPPALAIVTELAVGDLRGFINACSAGANMGGGGGMEGGLASLIRRVTAGQEATAGLLYLHQQTPPIVHRDIKPENFLVGAAGEIKICDFGLARDMHQTDVNTQHMGGSSIYIAPEVHRGQHFNTGCDVYAMALVVWELLTLKRPFHEFQEHMLPGLVGWGAQRPSMSELLEVAEGKKDAAEGAALTPLVRAIEAAWMQDPLSRPGLDKLYQALKTALNILEDGNILRRQPAGSSKRASEAGMQDLRVMF